MSRINFENIWISYNYARIYANCPICNCLMHKDEHLYAPTAWNRSHLMPVSRGGSDILPNVVPLCRKCNSSMGSLDYWAYLVKIGKMDTMTANLYKDRHINYCMNYVSKCKQNGCQNNRSTLVLEYCSQHLPPTIPMSID
jgi:hypothetical protein